MLLINRIITDETCLFSLRSSNSNRQRGKDNHLLLYYKQIYQSSWTKIICVGVFFSISQHLDSPDQSAALEKNDGTILWTLKTLPPQAESVAQFRVRSVFMLRINQFKNVIHVLYKYCMLAGIHL